MSETQTSSTLSRGVMILITLLAATCAFLGLALLTNIFEKKQEAKLPFARVVEITDDTDDPAVWGQNFPYQYDTFIKTVDHERTTFGGSETIPQDPTADDPRTAVAPSKLEHIPQHKRMWNGRSRRYVENFWDLIPSVDTIHFWSSEAILSSRFG